MTEEKAASESSASSPAAKQPWHAPTIEETDYTATEVFAGGGIYDGVVYSTT